MYQVVFHVDEVEKWKLTIGNINNLLKDTKGDIKVVVNGPAITEFVMPQIIEKIARLHDKGVLWYACRNSLRGAEIPPEQLPHFVQVVDTGVLKIIELQQEGYAYIKP